MTIADIPNLIGRYKEGYISILESIQGLNEPQLLFHRTPEKWSSHQIILHLADTEIAASFRIRNAISDPLSPIQPFDQDRWADHLDYEQQDLQAALLRLQLLRAANVGLLESLDEKTWEQKLVHPHDGEISLIQIITGQIAHVDNHIRQIRHNLQVFQEQQ